MVGESSITHAEYRAFVVETFKRNVQMFSRGGLPFAIETHSDEFFRLWRDEAEVSDVFGRNVELGGAISFCYIDGSHAYESVSRDFEHCDSFLIKGGFVLFDDSADGSQWEVCRVIEQVKDTGRYEVVAANPNYLFKKKKK